MNISVKTLLIGNRKAKYNPSNDTPLNLALTYLKICMKEDGVEKFSQKNIKKWFEDFSEYLNEINDESMSFDDCLDEICSNVMWTNSPFAFDEKGNQVPNDYIRLAEKQLHNKLENILK